MISYQAYLKLIDAPGVYVLWGDRGTRYVGSSLTSIRRRYYKHLSDLRRNTHHNTPLQEVWDSGERFSCILAEYLSYNCSLPFIVMREKYVIETYYNVATNIPNSTHRGKRG
jgi:GIY-YIG catalytic domain